mgnify:CR=1 FL=1
MARPLGLPELTARPTASPKKPTVLMEEAAVVLPPLQPEAQAGQVELQAAEEAAAQVPLTVIIRARAARAVPVS